MLNLTFIFEVDSFDVIEVDVEKKCFQQSSNILKKTCQLGTWGGQWGQIRVSWKTHVYHAYLHAQKWAFFRALKIMDGARGFNSCFYMESNKLILRFVGTPLQKWWYMAPPLGCFDLHRFGNSAFKMVNKCTKPVMNWAPQTRNSFHSPFSDMWKSKHPNMVVYGHTCLLVFFFFWQEILKFSHVLM